MHIHTQHMSETMNTYMNICVCFEICSKHNMGAGVLLSYKYLVLGFFFCLFFLILLSDCVFILPGMEDSQQESSNSEVHILTDEGGPSSQHVAPSTDQKNAKLDKRKAAVKRKADSLKDETRKKKKKSIQRVQKPSYTVQHGEDMLLIISNVSQFDGVLKPKRKGCRRKKAKTKTMKRKKEPTKPRVIKATKEVSGKDADLEEAEIALGFDWSQRMPVEVLVKIFELVVLQDGAVPFLCR